MKATYLKKAICAVLAVGMLALGGCGRSGYICDDKAVLHANSVAENENGAVISLQIIESGGEDGRFNDWKVYQEDERFVLSFADKLSHEPEIFEISEAEYGDVMSFDFAGSIAKYEAYEARSSEIIIYDDVYFDLTLTYENGDTQSARGELNSLVHDFYDMRVKYRELQPADDSGKSADESSQEESTSQAAENENGRVVGFKYSETKIEDDAMTFWNVYREAGRYFLYYMNESTEESDNYEISEEEYIDVMSFDFAGSIAEYEARGGNGTDDGIAYEVGLTYEDGEHYHTWAKLDGLTDELNAVLDRYREPRDESSEQGSVQRDSGMPVKVIFIESGGIAGAFERFEVYESDGRFVFGYSSGFAGETDEYDVSISEEDYNDIMSLDYEKAFADYEARSHVVIEDGINYGVTLVYENGEEIRSTIDVGKVTKKFAKLYKKYGKK